MSEQGSSDRSFGFVFAGFFLVVCLFPIVHGAPARVWALGPALLFAVLAVVRPNLLAPFNRVWMRFGLVLHRIMSPVVMSLIFFLTVTPIGLFMRLLGKSPLSLEFDRRAESYWIKRPVTDPESMKRQF